MEKLKSSISQIAKAFTNSPEGGAFFIKYVLLPDTKENNKAITEFYNEIKKHFKKQKKLTENVISAFKYIRKKCMKNDFFMKYSEKKITEIIQYKALLNKIK